MASDRVLALFARCALAVVKEDTRHCHLSTSLSKVNHLTESITGWWLVRAAFLWRVEAGLL